MKGERDQISIILNQYNVDKGSVSAQCSTFVGVTSGVSALNVWLVYVCQGKGEGAVGVTAQPGVQKV